jgi:stage II sporulation protein AA (anti-sigma F factor antagonist)
LSHTIRFEDGPFGQVVAVSGDVDTHAAGDLNEAIERAAAAAPDHIVILDLTATNFVDSRTIGVLVDWSARLAALGGRLPIVCADENMLRLFRQIGLEQTLDLHDSLESAAHA